jgi:hypothetical protein
MPTIELLHRLDQQLPNIDTTHHLDLRLTLNPPPRLHEIAAAFENYIAKFGLDRDERSRSRDSIKERFQIARGEQPLAEFGRSASAATPQLHTQSQLCKHCAASARQRSYLGSLYAP